jgi:4,5-dihydroxyphthalate decarboxylase
MFARGDLDATCGLGPGTGIAPVTGLDRRHGSATGIDLTTLFPDPRQEGVRFFKKTGVYPPHHTTVVRESLVQEHPWVAISLMEAFEESKRIAIERLHQSPPALMVFGSHYLQEIDSIFGPDPFVYGVKANAKGFEMVQTFSVQQGLTERKQPWMRFSRKKSSTWRKGCLNSARFYPGVGPTTSVVRLRKWYNDTEWKISLTLFQRGRPLPLQKGD